MRFWGYDRATEVVFFVEADALARLCPKLDSAERGFLKAFDETRNRIHEVAEIVYARCGDGGKGVQGYVVAVKDFPS